MKGSASKIVTLKMSLPTLCSSAVFQLCGQLHLGELRRTFTTSSHLHLSGGTGKVKEVALKVKTFIT